jgi:hypothetical protein
MKTALRLAALAVSAGVVLSCATTSHVITGKARPPIDPSQVTVYSSPPAKYQEIAVINATSRSSFSFGAQRKMDTVIERLKKEAALLGANGVLLQATGSEGGGGVGVGVGTGTGGGFISTGIFSSSEHKTGRGLAIYVAPESSQ